MHMEHCILWNVIITYIAKGNISYEIKGSSLAWHVCLSHANVAQTNPTCELRF